jgi:hypothetical protein
MAGVVDQLRYDNAVFVRGAFCLCGETPVRNQLFALIKSKNNVGVADINGEKHGI